MSDVPRVNDLIEGFDPDAREAILSCLGILNVSPNEKMEQTGENVFLQLLIDAKLETVNGKIDLDDFIASLSMSLTIRRDQVGKAGGPVPENFLIENGALAELLEALKQVQATRSKSLKLVH